ncbi:serine/threonine protein kinase [Pendulispora brunnea]|uniref:non-specific serine/threonine protein kinase n=1 Tax=Pendulispora brunnea TaxID=2905690 RepID=A0ABZ2JXG6_9BACT
MAGGAAASERRESRYERLVKIASGGMATVYVGRLRGALGFEQLVAIKRPHAHLMQQPDLRRSLLAEAHLASRIRHANAVGVRDVEIEDDSILLVMDYVEGASFYELLRSARGSNPMMTIRAGLRVIRDLCAGLQAVHDLTDDEDRPLGAVHRDVSPQNVLVGLDGVARLADFGIAKCLYAHDISTREGTLKGKFSYMAPEYMSGDGFDQRADIFAVGVMLWELLAQRRLFDGDAQVDIVRKVLYEPIPPVSALAPELGYAFDAVVARALARNPAERFARASDLGAALDAVLADSSFGASHEEVGRFVRAQVGERLAERKQRIKEGLRSSSSSAASGPSTQVVQVVEPAASQESAVVSSRLSRHAARIALAAVAFVVAVLGTIALVATRTSSTPPPTEVPSEPPAVSAEPPPARLPPSPPPVQSAPAPSAPAANTVKPEKPKPRKVVAPSAGSDVPRPRGNPY